MIATLDRGQKKHFRAFSLSLINVCGGSSATKTVAVVLNELVFKDIFEGLGPMLGF
jgi:hypothetical protein